jgi:hypothetical protein
MNLTTIIILIIVLISIAVVIDNTTGFLTFVTKAVDEDNSTTITSSTTTTTTSILNRDATTTTTTIPGAAGGIGGAGGSGGAGVSGSLTQPDYLSLFVNPQYKLLHSSNSTVISVDMNSSYGVYAVQFSLYFNSSALNATNVTSGGFFWPSYSVLLLNNSVGRIDFAVTHTGQGRSWGYGTIATIGFYAKNSGYSSLRLEDVIVADNSINMLHAGVRNGEIEVQ